MVKILLFIFHLLFLFTHPKLVKIFTQLVSFALLSTILIIVMLNLVYNYVHLAELLCFLKDYLKNTSNSATMSSRQVGLLSFQQCTQYTVK